MLTGAATGHDPPGSIFARFLRFGLLAWGGPAAQIAMIDRECVEQEGWVSEATFRKTLAVYQVLPGPEAHELCVYLGHVRGGRRGAFLAGLGFMLPGFLLMLGLSALYVEAGLNDRLDEIFYGLNAAVGALVAAAVIRLGRRYIDNVALLVLALAAFALTVFADAGFLPVLLGSGLIYVLWTGAGGPTRSLRSFTLTPVAVAVTLAGTITLSLTGEIFLEGLKAGLVTFGGAYTVIPFLQESAVEGKGWLTQGEFLDGLAMAGALPAPAIIIATFVGYLTGGLAGGIAITVGIFLPAFVLPIFFHRQLVAIAESPRSHTILLGIAAGVIGLIAAAAVDLVDAGVTDVPTALLAVAAFAALLRWHSKLTVVAVIAACGLIGGVLQASGAV
ncbi:MAG: chromate efflux transporter [Solirubrobacterales bacterium]